MEKIITKRQLWKEERKGIGKYVVTVGNCSFYFVKDEHKDGKTLRILYEDLLHYPQYSHWNKVKEKILQELQQFFHEKPDNDIVLVYSDLEESEIKKIMLKNKKEFGEW